MPWEGTPLFQTLLKKRDFYAGGLMTLLGAAVTLDSMTYTLGTLTHMGPGMFPLMLGVTLTFVGVLILGAAMATPLSDDENILPKNREWFGWGCILAGPVAVHHPRASFSAWSPRPSPACSSPRWVTAPRRGKVLPSSRPASRVVGTLLFTYVLKIPFPMFRFGH